MSEASLLSEHATFPIQFYLHRWEPMLLTPSAEIRINFTRCRFQRGFADLSSRMSLRTFPGNKDARYKRKRAPSTERNQHANSRDDLHETENP